MSHKSLKPRRNPLSAVGFAALVGGGVIGVIFFVVLVAALFAGLTAWIFMLLLGALHSQWHVVPALGFWVCYLIFFIVRLLFGGTGSSSNSS